MAPRFGRIFGLSLSAPDLMIRIDTTVTAVRDGLCWSLDGVFQSSPAQDEITTYTTCPLTPHLSFGPLREGARRQSTNVTVKILTDTTPNRLACGQAERHRHQVPKAFRIEKSAKAW